MKKSSPASCTHLLLGLALAAAAVAASGTEIKLADAPIVVSTEVPPNVMMTMSVEWPTGTVAAYNDNTSAVAGYTCSGRDSGLGVCYFPTRTYLGYFDPLKCYNYNTTAGYFEPKALLVKPKTGTLTVDCSAKAGRWSGNFLNWASMHAIDSFRYAMTGGDRVADTTVLTVVEKSQHTGQGGYNQFPQKRIGPTFTANSVTVPATAPSTQSPETWGTMYSRVSDNDRRLWEGSSRAGKVLQVANNLNFWSTIPNSRFVKIQLIGTNVLSLAEVRLLPSTGTTNYAQGKTTSQSSTINGGVSSRAVDGNTNGTFTANSVTHTNTEYQPWWQVDLGTAQAVRRIAIHNRTDCCEDRLTNFYIFASSSDMSGRTMEQLLDDPAVWKYRRVAQIDDTSDGVADSDRELLIAPATTDIARDAMSVRVKLCDASVGLESNCKSYASGTVYKPTGVVQDKADKMRFGVMSYLNVDGQATMGGVLRSPLKYVGPQTIVPNGTPGTNARYEIDASGIVRNDPEGVVVTGGEYKSSGVINYLNRFGKTGTKTTLKSIDTVSEMFYESLRYVRGSVASGSNAFLDATPKFIGFDGADSPAARDGFPIYTDWRLPTWTNVAARDKEPVQYWCQKTSFVGIGDTNAWCDSWAPGNTLTSGCGSGTHDGGPSNDPLINVTTLGNKIGGAEPGLTGSLGTTWISNSRYNGYNISSLAYWANSHDIILDDAARGYKQEAHQTAQTYWVDVRETGSFNGIVPNKNQYWLAGRWGGYNNGVQDDQIKHEIQKTEPDDTFANPEGKNYFTGERPDTLIAALRSVFANISGGPSSAAPTDLTSNDVSTGTESYQVSFTPNDWTGEVIANKVSFDSQGEFVATEVWRAADKLDALNWNTGRKIVTYDPVAKAGIPFRDTSLSATQLAYFGATAAEQRDLVNYLRGERTYEVGTAAKYRARKHVLGDIVSADPQVVGAPPEDFDDELNPGFADFYTAKFARKKVLYVAANDGMLHAFDGTPKASGGNELFAYVPSALLSGPSTPATPSVDGIAQRANTAFEHRFLVDQAPTIRSVDFGSSGSPDWRTMLVGGLGKGGRGFYALDVTNPTQWTSESAVSGKVLWEFTDEDMGFSFAQPVITKMAKYGWVVMLTSGYNNITSATVGNRGKGFLYILDAKTGVLKGKISTGVGSEASPSGLAKVNAFTPESGDFTADAAYAGDLLGNLWRFDLTDADGAVPAPTKIAEFKDSANKPQPITAEPRILVNPGTSDRWVFAGTGRLLDLSDRINSQDQGFYAFRDGTRLTFATSATLPNGISFPIDSADLAELDDDALKNGLTPEALVGKVGWVRKFIEEPNGANERMVDFIVANSGVVAFATKIPANADECVPSVSSRVYAVTYATGATQLVDSAGEAQRWFESSMAVLRPDLILDGSGNLKLGLNTGEGKGGFGGLVELNKSLSPAVRLNWREVIQ
jgi:type IV pilus assembly protein PilY1